jgi:hypothetical protein
LRIAGTSGNAQRDGRDGDDLTCSHVQFPQLAAMTVR